jgi:poly(A) polymerase
LTAPPIVAPWLSAPATQAVCRALTAAGHQALLVGGCVRNALIGRPVADIDIATDAVPEAVMALARAAGLHAVPTGIEHGTVTVVAEHRPFEVTTFRRDVETFGRRAVVAYTREIAEDAARRDFTMNALYARPDGTVVDPLGGLPDLQARRVRFVGDARSRIAEDFLRILRFFRIHAWYGDPDGGLDPEGLAACAAHQDGLARLSRERVGAEIAKLLAAADPAPAVAAMAATGILARVLPRSGTSPPGQRPCACRAPTPGRSRRPRPRSPTTRARRWRPTAMAPTPHATPR